MNNEQNKKKVFKSFRNGQYSDLDVLQRPNVDEELLKEKALKQMLHDQDQEEANDLIEWEDDGGGNFIQH